ncbi:MAG: penicillin acylase family protein [Planctomycetaceae bacterium]
MDGQSQSGQPGSPHYDDQLVPWTAGEYHFLPLDRADVVGVTRHTLRLEPC